MCNSYEVKMGLATIGRFWSLISVKQLVRQATECLGGPLNKLLIVYIILNYSFIKIKFAYTFFVTGFSEFFSLGFRDVWSHWPWMFFEIQCLITVIP